MPDYPVTVQMHKLLEKSVAELAEKLSQLAQQVSELQDRVTKPPAVTAPAAVPAPTKARSVWD
jgi:dihydroneopterin aldolase